MALLFLHGSWCLHGLHGIHDIGKKLWTVNCKLNASGFYSMALLASIPFMDFTTFMVFMAGMVFIFFMVGLAFMVLALATCRRIAMKEACNKTARQ